MGATDTLCEGLGETGDIVCETEGVGEGGVARGLLDKIGLWLGIGIISSRAAKMALFTSASIELSLLF